MTTRIYQGKIVSAKFEKPETVCSSVTATDAILDTFRLFQEATNYHLVALAGMGIKGADSVIGRFRDQVEAIWDKHPKDKPQAQTLQQSISATLGLPANATFEEALDVIYDGCERRDVLPYVLKFLIVKTEKGEGVIKTQGKELLPKLCAPSFAGNYDYSAKGRIAIEGRNRLIRELGNNDITQEEREALANEMDISWTGIKTPPDDTQTYSICYSQEETAAEVKVYIDNLCHSLQTEKDRTLTKFAQSKNIDLLSEVKAELEKRPFINSAHLLAKPGKGPCDQVLKQVAVFFMYYPCKLSAEMLKEKLGKEKVVKKVDSDLDFYSLENDPVLLARGKRGYIYRGFTALPDWAQDGGEMYSKYWDMLAFKEALKTLHSFELKTQERNIRRAEIEEKIEYCLNAKGKIDKSDDESEIMPVLKGDMRFHLLEELVKELSPDESTEYTVSIRALNAYEEIREKWLDAEKRGEDDKNTLLEIVRKQQGRGERFGSGVLFEALCEDKYRPIWHDYVGEVNHKIPRSNNILRDFSRLQELQDKLKQYQIDVRITAAESVYSPRQLLLSDLEKFGSDDEGCVFEAGKKGEMRFRVAVRDGKGYWTGATVRVRYSAPRFERDELGIDYGCWVENDNPDNTRVSWLRPMMKALGVDEHLLHLSKPPAVALQVKRMKHSDGGGEYACYLNFPVTLDLAALQKCIGKAPLWDKQIQRGADKEKLYLHWPVTCKNNATPWWKNTYIRERGFNVLGVDLGVRYAAAWALIKVQTSPELTTNNGSVIEGRCIGVTDGDSWYGFIRKQGLIRLDGEGSMTKFYANRDKGDVHIALTPPGVAKPTQDDLILAESVLSQLKFKISERCKQNVLLLGNEVIKAFRRLISRCRAYQSLFLKLKTPEKQEAGLDFARRYFSERSSSSELISGIGEKIERGDVEGIASMLFQEIFKLRKSLPQIAGDVTNLILPRKRGKWQWIQTCIPNCISSGRIELQDENTPLRHIYHRGGLSISRLSQLERLRQTLQSLNRVLWAVPGENVAFGRDTHDLRVADPCPELLVKIDNVREQRVNKIAHDIVAQALGVRLVKTHENKNAEGRDIIHGVYEKIPNREPVDFVVLENLSRYLMSVDRSPEETQP